MGSILGLQILVGVPIRVKDNDSISGLQVEAKTTGTGWQQEQEVLAGGVEETQQLPAVLRFSHTYKSVCVCVCVWVSALLWLLL